MTGHTGGATQSKQKNGCGQYWTDSGTLLKLVWSDWVWRRGRSGNRCGFATWVETKRIVGCLLSEPESLIVPLACLGFPRRQHDTSLSAVVQGEGVTDLSGQILARSFGRGGAKIGAGSNHRPRRGSSVERVVLWVSRLVLPAIACLLGQVLYG